MKKKRLLAVQGPLQYITGYIAFDWYAQLVYPGEDCECVLLLYDFLSPPEVERSMSESVIELSRTAPWSKVAFINGEQMIAIMRGHYKAAVERLHETLGHSCFDEIFLARDYIGDGSPLLISAFPKATRVTYGDSFGLVGQRDVLAHGARSSWIRAAASYLRRMARRALRGGPAQLPFDAGVLILPMDMSGQFFKKLPLVVPPRDHVVRCVETMRASLVELNAYCEDLMAQGCSDGGFLYLLSNLAASGLTCVDDEVALYVEVIEQTAPAGATVYIKHHPRSGGQVLSAVIGRLRQDYTVVVLDDVRFSRVPVELWGALIARCHIVAMFSTSATNLKYLYGKDVLLPLTDDRLRRFFPSEKVPYMAEANRMISETIDRLEHWDQKSVLWEKVV